MGSNKVIFESIFYTLIVQTFKKMKLICHMVYAFTTVQFPFVAENFSHIRCLTSFHMPRHVTTILSLKKM